MSCLQQLMELVLLPFFQLAPKYLNLALFGSLQAACLFALMFQPLLDLRLLNPQVLHTVCQGLA
jgi:hypothetical protein